MSTMRVYTREFRESAVGLVLSRCCPDVVRGSVDPRSGRGPWHALPHAAQLGPRPAACAAKDDCQGATKDDGRRTGARARARGRGAHPYRVASNVRFTEDHARASETWSRRSSQHGLANHAGVRNPCEICAKYVRKYRPTTTQSAHAHAPSPDLLERDFTADGPNKKWLCDITYIPTDEGFLYLAGVMDAWSRSHWDGHGTVMGWSWDGACRTRCMRRLRQMRSRWP